MPPVGVVTAQLTLELDVLDADDAELEDVEVLVADPEPTCDVDSLEKLLLERPSEVEVTDSDVLAVAEAEERPECELVAPTVDVLVREAERDADPFDDAPPADSLPEPLELTQPASGFEEQAVATQAMTRSGRHVQDRMDNPEVVGSHGGTRDPLKSGYKIEAPKWRHDVSLRALFDGLHPLTAVTAETATRPSSEPRRPKRVSLSLAKTDARPHRHRTDMKCSAVRAPLARGERAVDDLTAVWPAARLDVPPSFRPFMGITRPM